MPLTPSPGKCPTDALLRLLSGPWTTTILWVLGRQGPTRFGALRRAVGDISPRVLTERLRRLEAAGLVFRDYRPSVPPEVNYGLTARGRELEGVFDALSGIAQRWAREDAPGDGDCPDGSGCPPAGLVK